MAKKITLAELEVQRGRTWLYVRLPLPPRRIVLACLAVVLAILMLHAGVDAPALRASVEILKSALGG